MRRKKQKLVNISINNIKDVYSIASRYLPNGCKIKRIKERHANNKMGFKLIVGLKVNPTYDAKANPKRVGLSPELVKVAVQNSKTRVADVRIIWIDQGITASELISMKGGLKGIKKSLETKEKTLDKDITTLDAKEEISDDELAEMLDKGEESEIEETELDDTEEEIDEEEEEEIGEVEEDEVEEEEFEEEDDDGLGEAFDEEAGEEEQVENETEDEGPGKEEDEGFQGEVTTALNSIIDSIGGIESRMDAHETRLEQIEDKPVKKKKKVTKKKKTTKRK